MNKKIVGILIIGFLTLPFVMSLFNDKPIIIQQTRPSDINYLTIDVNAAIYARFLDDMNLTDLNSFWDTRWVNISGDIMTGDLNVWAKLRGNNDFNFSNGTNECAYDISNGSFSCGGENTLASGAKSVSFGQWNTASGAYSGALYGFGNTASATSALAGGNESEATQNYAIGLGNYAIASGEGGIALGTSVKALGLYSGAIGSSVIMETARTIGLGLDVNVARNLWVGGDLNIKGDANIGGDMNVVSLTASGLTATRIPFSTTGGLLTDDAALTFASGTGTLTSGVGVFNSTTEATALGITRTISTAVANIIPQINNNLTISYSSAVGTTRFLRCFSNTISDTRILSSTSNFNRDYTQIFNTSATRSLTTAARTTDSSVNFSVFADSSEYNKPTDQDVYFQGTNFLLEARPEVSGGQNINYDIYGSKIRLSYIPVLTSGTITSSVYGYVALKGTITLDTTTPPYYAFYNDIDDFTTNWNIYNLSVANNFMGEDNSKTFFGTGADASIYYDATNLIINPKEVGTGALMINGDTNISNDLNVTGNIYYGEALISTSPAIFCGKQDNQCFAIDFKTKTNTWCNKTTGLCDTPNLDIQEKMNKISCTQKGNGWEYINQKCTFNQQTECEARGKEYYLDGTTCKKNPYWDCIINFSKTHNWIGTTCTENPQKVCENQNNDWNAETNTCETNLQKQCEENKLKNWDGTKCIDDLQAICLLDRTRIWNGTTCINANTVISP